MRIKRVKIFNVKKRIEDRTMGIGWGFNQMDESVCWLEQGGNA